ncbi:VCBS repeat-containing protein [bacterium]|nr:VCBS repeat-containing protein [bacterium]
MDGPGAITGTWSLAPVYDSTTGRTFLFDGTASFTPAQLAGEAINANTGQKLYSYILDNTTTSVIVFGDASTIAGLGASYKVADFHLRDGSQALDRASSTSISEDFESEARPGADGLFDIGVDEADPSFTPPPDTGAPISFAADLAEAQTTAIFHVPFRASDSESGIQYVDLYYRKDGGTWSQYGGTHVTSPISFDTSTTGGDGLYDFYTIAFDNASHTEAPPAGPDASTRVMTSFAGSRVYVDIDATGAETGLDWDNAFQGIQLALDVASGLNVPEIWVAGGVYSEMLDLPSSVSLYGSFQGIETSVSERPLISTAVGQPRFSYETILDGAGLSDTPVRIYQVGNVVLDAFTITGSQSTGIRLDDLGAPCSLRNCRFQYCSGGLYARIVESHPNGVMIVERCSFLGNNGYGVSSQSIDSEFLDCAFVGNSGAGISMYGAACKRISRCLFSGNGGSAIAMSTIWQPLTIEFSTIVGNNGNDGAGIQTGSAQWGYRTPSINVRSCILSGNNASGSGGAAFFQNDWDSLQRAITNCVIFGNKSGSGTGGGVYCENNAEIDIVNTIFSGNTNYAVSEGTANADATVTYSHFFDNSGGDYYNEASQSYTGANAINANVGGAKGIIDGDPYFILELSGNWTADASYSAFTCQSALTQSGAGWQIDEHAGRLVNPENSQPLQFYIVSNTADTITVWGNVTAIASSGDPFTIYDYHLQNYIDGYTHDSPCIDMGDPASPYDNELENNGNRVNIGRYGNTTDAARASHPWERAAEGLFGGVREPLYAGGFTRARPVFADIDNDGDLDLFVGDAGGGVTLFRNDGTRAAMAWSFVTSDYVQTAGTVLNAAPTFCDVDGDADQDLFVGASDGNVRFYRNDGTRSDPSWTLQSAAFAGANFGTNATPTFCDVDGDDDMDMFVGNDGGTLGLLRNDGERLAPSWTIVGAYDSIGVTGSSAPSFYDLDGDGDFDLLLGASDGTVAYWQNTGSYTEASWSLTSSTYAMIDIGDHATPFLADLDADQDPDLCVGELRGNLNLFVNDGNFWSPSWRFITENFGGIDVGSLTGAAVHDLDDDGLLEMFVGSDSGRIVHYRNAGSPVVASWELATEYYGSLEFGQRCVPVFCDIDEDGDLDLFAGLADGSLTFVRNTGSATGPSWGAITANYVEIDVGTNCVPTFGDLDDDGDLDLLLGRGDGKLTYYVNNGSVVAPSWLWMTDIYEGLDVGDNSAPSLHDVDGDGDSDLFLGNKAALLRYFSNAGNASLPSWIELPDYGNMFDMFPDAIPQFADLDGDGDGDMLVGGRNGGVQVYMHEAGRLSIDQRSVTILTGQKTAFTVSDPDVTLSWTMLRNDSGGSIVPVTASSAEYTAGDAGGERIYDVVEVRDTANDGWQARVLINVLSAADLGSAGKVVICAGWKSASDDLWASTDYVTQLAYKTCRVKGFSREDIYFLSPVTAVDVDGDGDDSNDVDAESTMAGLEYALRSWAVGASDLTVFLADHGWEDNGEGSFRINEGDGNVLQAETLDLWLDVIHAITPGQRQKVIVDCCNAGAFLSYLTPPGNEERLVATSCGPEPEELAHFLADGLISFSEAFWNSIFSGSTYGQAFVMARDAMDRYQTAMADDDGDGVFDAASDTGEGTVGWSRHIGFSFLAGADRPQIGRAMPNTVLPPNTTEALLWVDDVAGSYPIERVWAVVVPPDYQVESGSSDPVLDLPRVELFYNRSRDRWEGEYDDFTAVGAHKIVFYAEDVWQSVSLPKQVYVHKVDLSEKAIIVVGATPYNGSVAWSASNYLGGRAYCTLLNRGFKRGDIQYLNPVSAQDLDRDGLQNDVDADVTWANLQYAVNTWAGTVAQLTVYLVGEGSTDLIRLNSSETVSASALDTLLDNYQTATGAKVVLIIECEESGSFLDDFLPPAGLERVVETSCLPGTPSYCLCGGQLSFSSHFFSRIWKGVNLDRAFRAARDAVQIWTLYAQSPGLDDNADGEYRTKGDLKDGPLAFDTFLGAAFLTGGDDLPVINDHSQDALIDPGTTVTIWASGVFDSDGIASVTATVIPQEPLDPYDAVNVPLTYNASTRRWEADQHLATAGDYVVCLLANDRDGYLSLPYEFLIQANSGDAYEVDDGADQASEYILSDLPGFSTSQLHSFHDEGDADWIKFYVPAGSAYTVKVTDPNSACDAKIELYASTTATLPLASVDNEGEGVGEQLSWSFTWTGYYYAKIYGFDPLVSGDATSYTLEVSSNTGANAGLAATLGSTSLSCSWSAGLRPGDIGYNLYRKNDPDGEWTKVNAVPIGTNDFDDTVLEPDTIYYYMVRVETIGGDEPQWTPIFYGTTASDATPPEVSAVARLDSSPTGASSVRFTVTFTEDVSGIDMWDFTANVTGVTGASVTAVSGSGDTWMVTVNTGSGSGTLDLNVVDDDSIHDGASNPLGGSGAGNGNFSGSDPYTLERTPPSVLSIARVGSSPTNASLAQFTVLFDESVNGVGIGDFGVSASGLVGATATGVSGSGDSRTVTVSTGSGAGTLDLNVADDDTIIDDVGNPLGGPGAGNGDFHGSDPYTIDRESPRVSSASALSSTAVRVTFHEPMTNNSALADAPNYVFSGDGAALTASSAVRINATEVAVTVNEMTNGASYLVEVNTGGAGPTDLLSNHVDPGSSSAAFSGLGTKPYVVSAAAQDANTVRVLFNESMTNDDALTSTALYTFSGGGVSLVVSAVTVTSSTAVDLTVNEMTGGASYTVQVETGAVGPTDLALNHVDSNASDASFSGMGVLPQVVSTAPQNDTTVRVIFSEPMADNDALTSAACYTFSGGVTPLTASIVLRVDAVTADVTVNTMTLGESYTIHVVSSSGPVDLAENPVDPAHNSVGFTGLDSRPAVAAVAATNATTVRVGFSKSMMSDAALTNIANYTFSGGGVPLSAAFVTRIDASTLDITVNEMTDAASYNVAVETGASGPMDLESNHVDPSNASLGFTGIGAKPQIVSATARSTTIVRVVFSESMANDGALTNAASYTFTGGAGGLSALSVTHVDSLTVDVSVNGMANGLLYTVHVNTTVTGPTDQALNHVDPGNNSASFNGLGDAPVVTSVSVHDGANADVTFDKTMGTGVDTPANYTLSGGGRGTLAVHPDSVTHQGANTYRLTWNSGEMFSRGDITVSVSGVEDAVGNPVGTPNSDTDTGAAVGTPPQSEVTGPSDGAVNTTVFTLTWTCTDDTGPTQSGVRSVSIIWSDDGGFTTETLAGSPFAPSMTSTPFNTPQNAGNGTYHFYSLATDNAGNVESSEGFDLTVVVDIPEHPAAVEDEWLLFQ